MRKPFKMKMKSSPTKINMGGALFGGGSGYGAINMVKKFFGNNKEKDEDKNKKTKSSKDAVEESLASTNKIMEKSKKSSAFAMKGKSPMMKALIGKQNNLPEELKAKILASPAKKYKSDAQRKAVHASKAEKASAAKMYGKKSAMKNYKKGYYGA
tara:strand:+ start:46 stop:510 length:465 start_codon:yes stop_codon:yes gene_type:complete